MSRRFFPTSLAWAAFLLLFLALSPVAVFAFAFDLVAVLPCLAASFFRVFFSAFFSAFFSPLAAFFLSYFLTALFPFWASLTFFLRSFFA